MWEYHIRKYFQCKLLNTSMFPNCKIFFDIYIDVDSMIFYIYDNNMPTVLCVENGCLCNDFILKSVVKVAGVLFMEKVYQDLQILNIEWRKMHLSNSFPVNV